MTSNLSNAFDRELRSRGIGPLARGRVRTLQVNVGKLCNQACHHCHVEAGPTRTERMTTAVAERVIALLEANPIEEVDLTGGAPELNENFRALVKAARRLGRRVVDRCNLTVMLEPGQEDLPEFLAAHGVAIVASLPCYTAKNVDSQRGRGVFEKSIEALRKLNALGYGRPGSSLELNLAYNPLGAYLPGDQANLEGQYRQRLREGHGVEFHRLLTIANMPVNRFAQTLAREGSEAKYMSLLVNHFNPQTVPGLMCRSLLSVGWDGQLYDCDFNQMLELPLGGRRRTVFDLTDFRELDGAQVATGAHCLGCTAGAGSGCSGAIQ